jgi:hypothetical protein
MGGNGTVSRSGSLASAGEVATIANATLPCHSFTVRHNLTAPHNTQFPTKCPCLGHPFKLTLSVLSSVAPASAHLAGILSHLAFRDLAAFSSGGTRATPILLTSSVSTSHLATRGGRPRARVLAHPSTRLTHADDYLLSPSRARAREARRRARNQIPAGRLGVGNQVAGERRWCPRRVP